MAPRKKYETKFGTVEVFANPKNYCVVFGAESGYLYVRNMAHYGHLFFKENFERDFQYGAISRHPGWGHNNATSASKKAITEECLEIVRSYAKEYPKAMLEAELESLNYQIARKNEEIQKIHEEIQDLGNQVCAVMEKLEE